MSVEDQIALATQQVGEAREEILGLVDVAAEQIVKIGDAYAEHIAHFSETFFVSAAGSDTNSGLDENNPLQTIKKAVDLTPGGGTVEVKLLTDFHQSTHVICLNKTVIIKSSSTTKHRVSFERGLFGPNNQFRKCEGFVADLGFVGFRGLVIVLPNADGGSYGPASAVGQASIVRASQSETDFCQCSIAFCDIEVPTNPLGSIVAADIVGLKASSFVETGEPVAGHWIRGVAAATDPATLTGVTTTLSSL